MKEYLKYVLNKNTDREQYIKCYHTLFKSVYIYMYICSRISHTHTYMCIDSLWKDIQDTGNMIVAGDEN